MKFGNEEAREGPVARDSGGDQVDGYHGERVRTADTSGV